MAFIPLYDDNPHRFIGRGGQGVTWFLIALNVSIYVVFQSGWMVQTPDGIIVSFALVPAIFNGEMAPQDDMLPVPGVVTLVTYAFLHGDVWHLAGNMVFLWVFGDNVEDAVGHWRYLAFYCLSAVGGG